MPNWRNVQRLPPLEQIPIFRAHLERKPEDAAIWFDLGLAYKQMRDWRGCISANQRALEISREEGDPAWWNLGIAATAMRDWRLARGAWRGYGLPGIEQGNDPLVLNYGSTPVRLPNDEVVWGERIDPARVIIRNIPFPDAGYRWGDIVLHDGAPSGEREVDGQRYPVFDALERWSVSEIPTLAVDVECAGDSDSIELIDLFGVNRFAAEDWTANTRPLCAACSHGLPSGHNHVFGTDDASRSFGLACPMGLARELLEQWRSAAPETRQYGDVHVAVEGAVANSGGGSADVS